MCIIVLTKHGRDEQGKADTEQRSKDRVGGKDRCGMKEVRVDEVVETTKEYQDHSTAEGG